MRAHTLTLQDENCLIDIEVPTQPSSMANVTRKAANVSRVSCTFTEVPSRRLQFSSGRFWTLEPLKERNGFRGLLHAPGNVSSWLPFFFPNAQRGKLFPTDVPVLGDSVRYCR